MAEQLRSRPALLRYWRKRTGLTQEAVGKPLGVKSVATIHNWETGQTDGPSPEQLEALDKQFAAGGALRDLYLALRTPDALTPTEHWWHNFQGTSGPCWAWLRVPGDQPATAHAEAGPFRVDCEVPPGTGLFLQAYAHAPNPPVHVRIDGGGWADYGHGILPADIGAPVVNAADTAVIGPRDELDNALVVAARSWFPDRHGQQWYLNARRFLGHYVDRARSTLMTAAKAAVAAKTDVSSSPASLDEVPRHWGGERYRRLREARGLSLQDVAGLASKLDPGLPPVTKDHVYRLEGGSNPRVTQLVERLDKALGADGRTCTAEISDTDIQTDGSFIDLDFPKYWVGPVWVQFLRTKPTENNNATLSWSPWYKKLALRDGVVVTTRRSLRRATAAPADQTAARMGNPRGRRRPPPGNRCPGGLGTDERRARPLGPQSLLRGVETGIGWGAVQVKTGLFLGCDDSNDVEGARDHAGHEPPRW